MGGKVLAVKSVHINYDQIKKAKRFTLTAQTVGIPLRGVLVPSEVNTTLYFALDNAITKEGVKDYLVAKLLNLTILSQLKNKELM